MRFYRYIASLYLRFFFVILFGLELFFVGLDFIEKGTTLPESANMKVLFALYDSMYALSFTLPLSLLLATILTLSHLIRQNEVTAFFAIGYSKKELMRPFFGIALLFSLLFIGAHFTSFAYSKEQAEKILDDAYFLDSKANFFLKHKGSYIYFKRFFPLIKRAEEIRVFEMEEGYVRRVIKARSAYFDQDIWVLQDAEIISKPARFALGDGGVGIEYVKSYPILKDFRPKILDSVYEMQSGLSIQDALDSIRLFEAEGVEIGRIKSILFSMTLFPLFAPFVILIIIYFAPTNARFYNVGRFGALALLGALTLWGVMYGLMRLSISGMVPAELGVAAPVLLLAVVSAFIYSRSNLIRG